MRALLLALAMLALPALAAPVKTEHVEAELLAARTAAEPGRTLTVAVRLRIIPHWHTYWRNPGDSGQPTQVEWQLPPGWSAGEIQWPAPRRLPARHLMNFGYEDEVLHLVDLAVPPEAAGNAKLVAKTTWLVCNEDRCIPEEGDLALVLPVGKGEDSAHAAALARTRAALPVKAPADWRFNARRSEAGVDLEIAPPGGAALRNVAFFPFQEGKIENAGTQAYAGGTLALPTASQPVGRFTRVSGLLLADNLPRGLEIDVPVAGGAGSGTAAGGVPSLAVAVLFAFLGGLILNLMPCVLPVLSIKILGFAGGNRDDRAAMRLHGALFALGVVGSFLLLAALLAGFNALGSEVGWGFQLQSPVVVGVLALLFLALALNLSGVFEFGQVLPAGLAGKALRNPRADALFSGVLAVAVASPCTAPFMGSAIGYALGESAWTTLAVFSALGAGMALPYLALSWNPAWLRWLPRPGPWMKRFKQVLAVPLYATVAWLGWVLALQAGLLSAAPGAQWEPFSAQRVESHNRQGRAVFVDFTAAWCVTCQVNKQLVLGQPYVQRDLKAAGYTLMRADWTRRDEEITRALADLGRKGVPVYAVYRPDREPQLLPEILTREVLFTALGTHKESQK